MTYFLENLSWILPSIIAILAIAIPIYYQYHRKNEEKNVVEIPESIIIVIANQSATIKQVTEENRSLQVQLSSTKLLAASSKDEFSKRQLNHMIKEIINVTVSRDFYLELEDILLKILSECQGESDIVNLFKEGEEHNYIFDLLNSIAFKEKICRILVKIYCDPARHENLQNNASLLWLHIKHEENIRSFTYGRMPLPQELGHDLNTIIPYFWSIVNIGFEYYTHDTFLSFRNEFSQKFKLFLEVSTINEVVKYIDSVNPKIVQAAAWSLVWLMNTRNEKNKPLWQPDEGQLEILYSSFTKNKSPYGIKSLVSILNSTCEKTNGFQGNFSYDCAFAMDNDSDLPEVEWEPINEELTKVIYLKYLSSSDEIKDILAKYLAKYGFNDLSVASRLLTKYLTEKDDDFILSILMPYVSVNADKGLISYSINWLQSSDKKVVFYGLLLRKILGKINTEIIAKLGQSKHISSGLSELTIPDCSQLELFEKKKTRALYNVIKLMAGHAYIVRGKDSTKRKAWYYILINPCMERHFSEVSKIGNTYNLEDYGKIIVSEYGKKPPADIDEVILNVFN